MRRVSAMHRIRDIIRYMGDDPSREGLIETPMRVTKMWDEMFKGYNANKKPVITTFNNGKDGITYDQMICDTGIFYSHCEHHMVPFFGKYYFAYIPNPKGKLLGLSKVARVVDYYSAKLQVQERLVQDIVDYLFYELSKDSLAPLGMALVIDGEHLCKTMRGVKKKGQMRTTKLVGVFKTDPATRSEFMSWVNKNG